jgi:hypothetical protein
MAMTLRLFKYQILVVKEVLVGGGNIAKSLLFNINKLKMSKEMVI